MINRNGNVLHQIKQKTKQGTSCKNGKWTKIIGQYFSIPNWLCGVWFQGQIQRGKEGHNDYLQHSLATDQQS